MLPMKAWCLVSNFVLVPLELSVLVAITEAARRPSCHIQASICSTETEAVSPADGQKDGLEQRILASLPSKIKQSARENNC